MKGRKDLNSRGPGIKKSVEILKVLRKYRFLIILIAVIGSHRFIFLPLIQGWQGLSKEIKIYQEKLTKALPLLRDEEKVNSLYNTLVEVLQIQPQAKEKDPQRLSMEVYRTLTQIANKCGLSIKNYRPKVKAGYPAKRKSEERLLGRKSRRRSKERREKKTYPSIEIDLDLEAELPQLIRFAYYLENSAQLMEIERANITASSKKGLSVRLKVKKRIF